ncbi:MAG: prepilin-type N-terminal cleavage/methylation domain-containing protein [Vulcanimicrobiota bacterium]
MCRWPATERAFTLAEVLVAMAVLSIALLGTLSMQTFALSTQSKSTQRHTASLVASTVLSEVEQSLKDDFETSTGRPRAASTTPGFEVEVAEVVEDPDLKRVEVRVFWTDDQAEQNYRLWTRLLRE